jgi:hypothetical protein
MSVLKVATAGGINLKMKHKGLENERIRRDAVATVRKSEYKYGLDWDGNFVFIDYVLR